jgi:aquaporin Z
MFGRKKIAALVAEFLGAGLLTITILSVEHSGIGYPYFVATAAGLAFASLSFAAGKISGGHFNPAITIGQWTAGKISTLAGILYIAVQLLGGWAAYYLYIYLVNNHLTFVGGHHTLRIFVAELVGTALFSFVFAATVYEKLSRAAVGAYTGVGLIIGSLVASSGALGLLNPAVALGARAWVWSTYVAGPIVGAFIGTQIYALLFADERKGGLLSLVQASVSSRPAVATATTTKTTKKVATKKRK